MKAELRHIPPSVQLDTDILASVIKEKLSQDKISPPKIANIRTLSNELIRLTDAVEAYEVASDESQYSRDELVKWYNSLKDKILGI